MKTAMQELISELKRVDDYPMMPFVIRIATDLLEKEKEQLMNAYSDGAKGGANGTKGQHKNGWVSIQTKEKYYKLLQQTK